MVAKVDGTSITRAEWDAAHQNEVERVRASMPSIDAKLLDSPEARYATLERLVRDRVLAAAANKSHLVPPATHGSRKTCSRTPPSPSCAARTAHSTCSSTANSWAARA